jgi:localization factor PodJL
VPAASRAPAPASDRADRAIVTGSVSPPEPVGATQPAAPAGASVPGHATQAEGPRRLELPPAPIGPLSLRLAAAKGDPAAQLEIAARYAEGKGVKQSFADAADWYVRAADQGLAVAQYRLAALYERGMGVKADAARARIWYERAARAGNIKAMHNLAVLSASHAAGQPDYAMAARWFAEAAERGLADSQFNLAILTESGQGVAKDLTRALTWYMLAARSGDREAARRRDQLIARLPEEAVQAADKAASEWRAKPADQRANDAKAAGDGWRRRVVGKGSA